MSEKQEARRDEGIARNELGRVESCRADKIVVAYDRNARFEFTPGFRSVGRYGQIALSPFGMHFDHYFESVIALEDVEFASLEGVRVGCAPTGVLGFACGRLDASGDLLPLAGLLSPIKFNGGRFVVRETGQILAGCRRLILAPDGKAVALLHDADARILLERTSGREASMPLAGEISGGRAIPQYFLDEARDRTAVTTPDYDVV